jgi:uncharacterized protein (DUF952 family)
VSQPILHIAGKTAWLAARQTGAYKADSLAGQGFIHCSKAGQVLRVANAVFTGLTGLVLLVIDVEKLSAPLRWEPGEDLRTELFPHVYGPINLDAVIAVHDFEPGPDGVFSLPVQLTGNGSTDIPQC